MAEMDERLPYPVSDRLANITHQIFARQGREVDVAVGGIPFRLATSQELPYTISTVPIRKDQFDTEQDPGEQSLAGWWRRSQASFHNGAGFLYQENSTELTDTNSFWTSEGVDVFTPGQFKLLKKMVVNATAGAFTRARLYAVSGSTYGVTAIKSGQLWRNTDSQGGALTSLHAPVDKTIVDGFISGANFYDVASDGTLYEGTVASPGTATTWPCGTTPARLGWGKHRLWIIGGRKIWQPDLTLTGGSTQNPVFTNPNQGWTYTCLAEGPGAMYFGGHDGQTSTVQAITLDAGGALPTLSGATVTAALPDTELVQEIAVLGGQYIGIGTSHGFRVGSVGTDASITYGPLIIEPEGVQACTALTTQGRFFVVAFQTSGNRSISYRVDTGTPLDGGVFPYAADADLGITGYINSLAGGRPGPSGQLVTTGSDGNTYYRSTTDYVASGYLQTGRIRFRTTERKFFRSLQIEVEPLEGQIAADVIQEGGGVVPVANLTEQGITYDDRYSITADFPQRYVSVKLTLTPPNGDATKSPTVYSYQLSAQPAVRPQRTYTVPLLCFDNEKSVSGQWYGGDNFGVDRYNSLLNLEDQSTIITYQDFTLGNTGHLVTIENVRFVRTTVTPASAGAVKGAGGIIILELKTVGD